MLISPETLTLLSYLWSLCAIFCSPHPSRAQPHWDGAAGEFQVSPRIAQGPICAACSAGGITDRAGFLTHRSIS